MNSVIENLALDKETGFLFWIAGKKAGQRAGGLNSQGYRRIYISGKYVQEHRVVWKIFSGEWPSLQVDHINGNRSDNRPCNLRLVDGLGQMRNRAMPSHNTSGVHGVTFHKGTGKWQAGINVKGKHVHLGLFTDLSAAAQARKSAETMYGFHENHGRPHRH